MDDEKMIRELLELVKRGELDKKELTKLIPKKRKRRVIKKKKDDDSLFVMDLNGNNNDDIPISRVVKERKVKKANKKTVKKVMEEPINEEYHDLEKRKVEFKLKLTKKILDKTHGRDLYKEEQAIYRQLNNKGTKGKLRTIFESNISKKYGARNQDIVIQVKMSWYKLSDLPLTELIDNEEPDITDIIYHTTVSEKYRIPKNRLTNDELYKLAYVFADESRDNHIEYDSMNTPVLHSIKPTILFYTEAHLKYHRMNKAGKALQYKLLEKLNGDVNKFKIQDNYCVPDYIFSELIGTTNNKTITIQQIRDEFEKICGPAENGYSVEDIIEWRNQTGRHVDVYAIDPFNKVFTKDITKDSRHKVSLVFVVNNHHLYPIYNQEIKNHLTRGRQMNIKLEDYKWDECVYENFVEVNEDNYDAMVNGDLDGACFILGKDYDICTNMEEVALKHNCHVDRFNLKQRSLISGFIHPISEKMILENNDFTNRKATCELLYNMFDNENFKFRNQSYSTISCHIVEQLIGRLPKSSYKQEIFQELCEYGPSPLIQTLAEESYEKIRNNVSVYDIAKAYSSSLMHNEEDIPVYSSLSEKVKYNNEVIQCGEYFLETIALPYTYKDNSLIVPNGWYSHALIKYLKDEKLIRRRDIKYWLKPTGFIKYDTFKVFVKFVFKNFPEKIAKDLVNMLIGTYNIRSSKSYQGTITDSPEICCALWDVEIYPVNDLYFLRKTIEEPLSSDNTSIWRHVICGGIMNMLKMIKKAYDPLNSQLVACNTDSIFVRWAEKIDDEDMVDETKPTIQQIGKYKMKPYECPKLYKEKEIKEYTEPEEKRGTGCLFYGMGGCGKTTKMTNMIEECEKKNQSYICLSYTNQAINVIKERREKWITEPKTLSSFLNEHMSQKEMLKKLTSLDVIFIDELSFVNNHFMNILYQAWKLNNKLIINMFGDMEQLTSINDVGTGRLFDYTNNPSVIQMCGRKEELPYIEGSGRYDNEMYKIIVELLETDRLKMKANKTSKITMTNICYWNATRKRINKLCCNEFVKGKKSYNISFKYQEKAEEYKVCEGMKIMATKNLRMVKIANMEQFIIEKMNNKIARIKNIDYDFPIEMFRCSFIPSFCITSHKIQGGCISDDYTIYDVGNMNKNAIYVAISRTTNIKYVHFEKDINQKFKGFVYSDIPIEMTINTGGIYRKGRIYEVVMKKRNEIQKYYIGSTTKTIEERLAEHMEDENSQVFKNKEGLECSIRLLSKAKCFSLKELEYIENKHINKYVQQYGDKCVNIRGVVKEKKKVNKTVVDRKVHQINITENEKCYRIRWSENSIQKKKEFGYIKIGKEEGLKKALTFRNSLVKRLYGI